MPASVRLAIDHDDGLVLGPIELLDREQFEFEEIDHRPVLGPTDGAVAGEAGRLIEAGLDQMGQAEHATEAIGVGVDVRNERHPVNVFKAG
jgi:hypothetical protein